MREGMRRDPVRTITRSAAATIALAGLAALLSAPSTAGGQKIERHETSGIVDLVPGAARGTIIQPLQTGTIASTGETAFFVITDASDKDFAEMFGVIGNILAGYSLVYRRAFRLGDRVKINEHVGDVVERRLLVTHLRSLKNEEVIVPNSEILNNPVINYSSLAKQQGLILHITVGIGYETPWRQVEAMLMEAADKTPGLLKEPPPFVLQQFLGDFCVTYELNVYCNQPHDMMRLYTLLSQKILCSCGTSTQTPKSRPRRCLRTPRPGPNRHAPCD